MKHIATIATVCSCIILLSCTSSSFADAIDQLASALADIHPTHMSYDDFKKQLEEIEKKDDRSALKELLKPENQSYFIEWVEKADRDDLEKVLGYKIKDIGKNYLILAFKNNMPELARKIFEKVPDLVTQKYVINKDKGIEHVFLSDLINAYEDLNYIGSLSKLSGGSLRPEIIQKRKDQLDLMLAIVDKSTKEQLMANVNYKIEEIALWAAVFRVSPELCRAILKKYPAMVQHYLEDEEPVFRKMISKSHDFMQSMLEYKYLNNDVLIKSREVLLSVINDGDYDFSKKELAGDFDKASSDIIDRMDRTSYHVQDDWFLPENKGFANIFFDTYVDLYKAMVQKRPEVLKKIVRVLNIYCNGIPKTEKPVVEQFKKLVKFAVNEYKKQFNQEKLLIGQHNNCLKNKDLQEGQKYTLDEILKQAELTSLLQ